MSTFAVRIDISHLPGIADPQGATLERALPALGFTDAREVHIGKVISLVVDAADAAAAERRVAEMCERILANPVIEQYTIAVEELVEA